MKIKHQVSIATLLVAGVFATGCSQQSTGGSQVAGGSQQSTGGSQVAGGSQSQIEGGAQVGSQQQVDTPAPVVTPAPTPKPAPVVRAPEPAPVVRKPVNRWGHTHPAIPNCTDSIRHTHKYNTARHSHKYSCRKAVSRPVHRPAPPKQPQVDVYALQRKLKAKGYYKGPVDGVVGPSTRSALKRFMNR